MWISTFRPDWWRFYPRGISDTSGRIFSSQSAVLKGQPQWVNPESAKYYPVIERAIFVGHIHDQYGHLITEFISRLWALANIRKPGDKLLVRCVRGLDEVFTFKWEAEIFDALGLTKDDFITPEIPVTIRELVVPSPAFAEQGYCYRKMAEFCNRIGDLSQSAINPVKGEKIYLSRSKLYGGTLLIDNEPLLEKALIDRGFQIVHPEELTFPEQISLFRNHNTPVGFVGSAFHTSIFTPNPSGVAINAKSHVDANYTMMDGVNEAEIDYIESDLIIESPQKDHRFFETKTITNIDLLTQNISDFVTDKRSGIHIPNMGQKAISRPIDFTSFYLQSQTGRYINIDLRTGRLTTEEGPFHKKVFALVFQNPEWSRYLFLFNIFDSSIGLEGSLQDGPVKKLLLTRNNNGETSLLDESVNLYLTITPTVPGPITNGGTVTSSTPEISDYEKYSLEPTNEFNIRKGTDMHKVLCLIAMKMDRSSVGNYEFYNQTVPHLVSFVDRILFVE
ncbi:glycosyltransferase family 61 protein [Asaia prunellae]|uniref:glycosyltransferase family 61 protein n=1 Tax=Asaia prunellae TaxID=610245 RepID=UPI000A06AEBB|nr:glycosyltransferase family 61 protein [Asaia prunellae]